MGRLRRSMNLGVGLTDQFAFPILKSSDALTNPLNAEMGFAGIPYNGKTGLMVRCPLSTRIKGHPFEVLTSVDGLNCAVLSDQVRSLDWKVRKAKRKTVVGPEVMLHVRAKIKALRAIP